MWCCKDVENANNKAEQNRLKKNNYPSAVSLLSESMWPHYLPTRFDGGCSYMLLHMNTNSTNCLIIEITGSKTRISNLMTNSKHNYTRMASQLLEMDSTCLAVTKLVKAVQFISAHDNSSLEYTCQNTIISYASLFWNTYIMYV